MINDWFPHTISFELEGRAGETKTVSAGASTSGTLLLFTHANLTATDTSTKPGHGTVIERLTFGDEPQLRMRKAPTHLFHSNRLTRSYDTDELHPRLAVVATIRFLEDCKWSGFLAGRAKVVPSDGVFAIAPTEPCARAFSFDPIELIREQQHQHLHWSLMSKAGARCQSCWFRFGRHETWPWKEHSIEIGADLAGGEAEDIVTAPPGMFVAHAALARDFDTRWNHDEQVKYPLRTDGFAIARNRVFEKNDYKRFQHYGHGVLVLPGEELLLRVGNAGNTRHAFRGNINGLVLTQ